MLKSNGSYLQPSKSSHNLVVVMKFEFLAHSARLLRKLGSCFALDTDTLSPIIICLLGTQSYYFVIKIIFCALLVTRPKMYVAWIAEINKYILHKDAF